MSDNNIKIKVGILRGGIGEHYESSLRRGGEIISYILENLSDKYKTIDILVDKEGIWHANGVPITLRDLENKVDVVWNTSGHPNLSATLGNLAVPNIEGEFSFGTLYNSNEILRNHIKSIGLQIPRSVVFPLYQKDFDGPREKYSIKKAKEVFEKFGSPWIVKSFTEDSNMGIHLAKTFPELVDAIEDGVMHKKSILVEEFIEGKVASVHSVVGFRGDLPALPNGREQAGDIYTFPLGNSFGIFSNSERERLTSLAKDLHKNVGAGYYSKSNFVLSPRGKVYLLNMEYVPDLKTRSHFSQVCESVGAKTHHVIEHIIEKALNKKV